MIKCFVDERSWLFRCFKIALLVAQLSKMKSGMELLGLYCLNTYLNFRCGLFVYSL